MNEKIINLTLDNKKSKNVKINDMIIDLPPYVINSISKYQFIVTDNYIYLQRQCNLCKKTMTVQKIINKQYVNIQNLPIRFIGKKSGFHNKCHQCEKLIPSNILKTSNTTTKNIIYTSSNLTQLNIKVDKDLKKYYQYLSVTNETTLNKEIQNALIFYKEHIQKG